jgi:small GTP-binding protein
MNSNDQLLGSKVTKYYEQLRALLQEGVKLAVEVKASDESIKTLREKLQKLECAALFVIVGEVKAGKSSFINALLREEICEVDAAPCTETIQELVYGEEKRRFQIADKWERLFLPFEQLKTITLVDTPGTNSIIQEHQPITENYLPQCDLAIFVLPAKNPHTATAWQLLDHIRTEWMHRVVFVLQQMDLATKAELDKNREMVRSYAKQRSIAEAKIFAVSATREQQGSPDSGYSEFREYLRASIETGEVWRIKFDSGCNVLRQVLASILSDLHQAEGRLWRDLQLLENLENIVMQRRRKIDGLRHIVIDSLLKTYDTLTGRVVRDFRTGLKVGTVLRRALPFVRDRTIKDWVYEMEKDFKNRAAHEIEQAAKQCCEQLEDEINALINQLDSKISNHRLSAGEMASDLVGDRKSVLDNLAQGLSPDSLRQSLKSGLPENLMLEGNILGGGGLVVIGAVVGLLTKVAIFDITGGILAATGAALIAITLLWKRSAIISDAEMKFAEGRNGFEQTISAHIENLFRLLFFQIDQNILTAKEQLDKSLALLKPNLQRAEDMQQNVRALRGE